MDNSKSASGGIGMGTLLFVLFLILHLAKVPGPWISGPQWWDGWVFVIFAPIAIGLGVTLVTLLVLLLVAAIVVFVTNHRD